MRTHLVVGAGRMGGALLSGWLADKKSGVTAKNLVILDPHPGGAATKAIEAGAKHLQKPEGSLSSVKVVLLAIKPQMFEEFAGAIAEHLPHGALVISILAGTSMTSLAKAFPNQTIIRAMPNTPSAIGEGITAFTCGASVAAEQKAKAQILLEAGGTVYEVVTENLIDVVTAVSGSGPAYVFYLVETLEKAAIKAGLPEDMAPDFARQTIIGAGALLKSSPMSATELREAVTSPGGTTQAALDVLMRRKGLRQLMNETVFAALARAKKLGG